MILLIDNYDSFTYNIYQLLSCYQEDMMIIRNDKISILDIKKLNPAAIVLSPGPGHPIDAGICMELISNFSGSIPILGICLGHQAIVQTFGGAVVRANVLVHGKSSVIVHDNEGLFKNLPPYFEAGRYHSLVAEQETLPECLDIHATCEPDLIMGIKHKDHHTYGLQFHPESILTPLGHRLFESFLAIAGVSPC